MNETELPVLDDSLNFNLTNPFPPSDDMLSLNRQVEQLSVDLNTQHVEIEAEKLKRQKLKTTIRRVRQESVPIHQVLVQLQNDNTIMREQLSAISNFYVSEIGLKSLVTHCYLSHFIRY